MTKITDIRLQNIRLLVDEAGNISELARRIGYNQPSYLYQILNRKAIQNGKPKNVGENMARKIEAAMGKEPGWLDQPHNDYKAKNINVSNNYGGYQNTNQYNLIQQAKKEERQELLPEEQAEFLKAMPLLDISDAIKYVLDGVAIDELQSASDKIATFINHSDKCFGVKMPDDSMTIIDASDVETVFKGDVLIVEPSIEPRDNDLVMLCLDYSNRRRPIIARLQVDITGACFIRQPNRTNGYIPMPDDALICGVIIEIKRRIMDPDIVKARHDDNWDIRQTLIKS